ncbi:MAG: hypothetical protein KF699_03150 [Phycisphaeraceae bacterium]|nr:hypothetical protein [Phycisphaeraceae bacterium]
MSNHWVHLAHSASHGGKVGAVVLIIIGIFLTPMLIGIPLIIWGVVKLFSK